MRENIYMLPSDMNLNIRSGDVGYDNKILVSDGNKINDLILNLTPENVTQHSRIVTTTRKGSSTPTKMSKIIGRQIH